jgi:tetratricopeptide (TPR) repeat protein
MPGFRLTVRTRARPGSPPPPIYRRRSSRIVIPAGVRAALPRIAAFAIALGVLIALRGLIASEDKNDGARALPTASSPVANIIATSQSATPNSNVSGTASAFYDNGVRYHQTGDCGRARAEYDKAIQLQPDFALAYSQRGRTNECRGLIQPAIDDYTRATELNPLSAGPVGDLGRAYQSARNYPAALESYSQAITLNPGYWGFYQSRGLLYNGPLNDPVSAIPDFSRCAELELANFSCLQGRGYAHERLGQIDLAIADFEAALTRIPASNQVQRDSTTANITRLRSR